MIRTAFIAAAIAIVSIPAQASTSLLFPVDPITFPDTQTAGAETTRGSTDTLRCLTGTSSGTGNCGTATSGETNK
ncbi:MAG: hypothetical protein ACWA47_03895 [Brevirhabdus sp.]